MNSGPVVGVPLPQHTRQGFAGLRTSTLPLPSQASHKNLMCSPVPLQIAHDTFIVGTLTPGVSVAEPQDFAVAFLTRLAAIFKAAR